MTGISQLPPEILVQIISFLPLKDRKNTRLVCREWLRANNERKISGRETLLCYSVPLYELDDIIQILENSERKILNLKFRHCDFGANSRSIQFWMNHGLRIESLWLSHCIFSKDTIKLIIVCCHKMRALAIDNTWHKWPPCAEGEMICSNAALDELMTSGIQRDSLCHLRLGVKLGWISNYFLHVLFTVCPNIESFSFFCDNIDGDFGRTDISDEALLISNHDFTSSSILRKLQDSKEKIKLLDLSAYNCLHWVPGEPIYDSITAYTFSNLKSFSTLRFEGNELTDLANYDFIARHPQLQSVTCEIRSNYPEETVTRLMNCLLDSCPNLKYLRIAVVFLYCSWFSVTDPAIFRKLRKSKLESLSLNFNLKIDPNDASDGITNETLKSLTFLPIGGANAGDWPKVWPAFYVFLKTFRNVTHLAITDCYCIDDSALQCIFQYQQKLTTLRLWELTEWKITDFGFTGILPDGQRTGYSIQQLSKLQCLELDLEGRPTITEKTLSEFKFPNLLYLNIKCCTYRWNLCADLLKIVSKFTELEGLRCYFKSVVAFPEWLNLCQQLQKLRFLEYKEFNKLHKFREGEYTSLFETCSTLRIFQHISRFHPQDDHQIYSYYYDVVHREIRSRPNREIYRSVRDAEPRYRIAADPVDTYMVQWLVSGPPEYRGAIQCEVPDD